MKKKKCSPEFAEFFKGEERENLSYIRRISRKGEGEVFSPEIEAPPETEKPKEHQPGMTEKRINKVFSENPLLQILASEETLQKKIKYYGGYKFPDNPNKKGKAAQYDETLTLFVKNILDHPQISHVLTPEEQQLSTKAILKILEERGEQITDKVRRLVRGLIHQYRKQAPAGLKTADVCKQIYYTKQSVARTPYEGYMTGSGRWAGQDPPEKGELIPVRVEGFGFAEEEVLQVVEKSLIQALKTYRLGRGGFVNWFKVIFWQDLTDLKREYIREAYKGPIVRDDQGFEDTQRSRGPVDVWGSVDIDRSEFDQKEKELIELVLSTGGARITNKELASRLGLTEKAIKNRKKKLQKNPEMVKIKKENELIQEIRGSISGK